MVEEVDHSMRVVWGVIMKRVMKNLYDFQKKVKEVNSRRGITGGGGKLICFNLSA
jgi:hypothetical protein